MCVYIKLHNLVIYNPTEPSFSSSRYGGILSILFKPNLIPKRERDGERDGESEMERQSEGQREKEGEKEEEREEKKKRYRERKINIS